MTITENLSTKKNMISLSASNDVFKSYHYIYSHVKILKLTTTEHLLLLNLALFSKSFTFSRDGDGFSIGD